MAKFDVIQKYNGNFTLVSSWEDNRAGAKQAYHHQCSLLYSDNAFGAVVEVVDDNLDVVDGCKTFIKE